MARANIEKSKDFSTSTTTALHQSTYTRGPEFAPIKTLLSDPNLLNKCTFEFEHCEKDLLFKK